MRTIEDVLNRLRSEFLETPGLRLKSEQVQRLCAVDRTVCQLLLDSLVDAKFLCVKVGGAYARPNDGAGHGPRKMRRQFSEPTGLPKHHDSGCDNS